MTHGPGQRSDKGGRGRRGIATAALLLLVVAMAVASALYSSSKEAFVASALSRYLGRYVEIGKIEVVAESALRVVIEDAQIFEGPEKSGAPILEVARARGSQPWSRILVGKFVPRAWTAQSLRAHLQLGGQGGGFDIRSLPSLSLKLSDGQVSLGFGADQVVEFSELELTTQRSALPGQLSGAVSGQVSWNGQSLGAFEADIGGHDDQQILSCAFSDLDLAAIPSSAELPIAGSAGGELRVLVSREAVAGSLKLGVANFSLQPPRFRAPIAPEDLATELDFSWDGKVLELRPEPLLADELNIRGKVKLSFGESGRLSGELEIAPFEPGLPARGRFEVMRFLALQHRSWQQIEQRVDAGRVLDGTISFDLGLDVLVDTVLMRRRAKPGELRYAARVEDGIYRSREDAPPLTDLRGSFSIDADQLVIRDLSFVSAGERIPELDIRVDGMRRLIRLPKTEDKVRRGSAKPTPGLGALLSGFGGDTEGELSVNFSHAELHYRPFLLPVREAHGVVRAEAGALSVEANSLVVGGVPAQLSARWERASRRVDIDLRYDPEAMAAEPGPGEGWFAADLYIDKLAPGGFQIEELAGRLEARDDEVEFRDASGRFGGGSLRANGRFSLAEQGRVPFGLETRVAEAAPAALLEPIGRKAKELTGTLELEAEYEGELIPNTRFFETVDLDIKLKIRDGEVSRDLPAFVQMLRLPSLSGISGLFGSNLPYEVLSADLQLHNQVLATQNLTLRGPELQAHVHGEIQLEDDPNQCDIVIEFLLVPTVDRMIDRVPIVGGIVLGENKSLIVFGVKLRGDCNDLNARAMAPGTIETATGWARDLIGSGAGQLRRIILGPQDEETDAESP